MKVVTRMIQWAFHSMLWLTAVTWLCLQNGCSGPAEDHGISGWFSAQLRALEAEEERLHAELGRFPALLPDQQTERLGYSSKPSWSRGRERTPEGDPRPPVMRMIRLDLGSVQSIDRIVLVPVDFAVDADSGAGYGFPVRWRIEVSEDPGFEEVIAVADQTGADFPNPGLYPVSVNLEEPVRGQFVRLTAVKLWERAGRSLLALGELMVLKEGRNLAAGLSREAIRVTDTDETPRDWSVLNLVDGQSVLGAPAGVLPSPTHGYQSGNERNPQAEKWVQVDLGQEKTLEEIRLFPARAVELPARRGFGFPDRWRLEASLDEDFGERKMLGDWTRFDFSNPYENMVVQPVPGVTARYVRLTAVKLNERFNDYVLALSEMEVWSGGQNVAAGRDATALDSRENTRWSTRFLTDGFSSWRQVASWPEYLDGLEQRRVREERLALLPNLQRSVTAEVLQRITIWVLGVTVASGLLTVWGIRRNERERKREMEALRQRIARDVHDEIGSGLGTIALLSQMAGSQAAHPEEARRDFAEIEHLSREVTESLRDIVWLIRPETRTLGDLAQRLKETAASMLAAIPHTFTVDPAVEGRTLPLEFKRQVLLIFKESLHNLMRHASATHAVVTVGGNTDRFFLELEDNGRGFDPGVVCSGAGLTGMRQRAATLGGTLAVNAAPGSGTRLRLEVPWPHRRRAGRDFRMQNPGVVQKNPA